MLIIVVLVVLIVSLGQIYVVAIIIVLELGCSYSERDEIAGPIVVGCVREVSIYDVNIIFIGLRMKYFASLMLAVEGLGHDSGSTKWLQLAADVPGFKQRFLEIARTFYRNRGVWACLY